MIERFIHHVRVEHPGAIETVTEARERLREKFPRGSVRRMTHVGLLIGSVLDGVGFAPDDALVYATTFAETRALEDYLATFPAPSPLLFQTSIHPSAVQQVMIARQQPLRRLWPITGRDRLVEHALLAACLEPARCWLVGGEERGTWMLEQAMASERAFAFALELTAETAGATGHVSFERADGAVTTACPSLEAFAGALAARRPLNWSGAGGVWAVTWA